MDRLRRCRPDYSPKKIELLREQGSWGGETHIQKSTLFDQDLIVGPSELRFHHSVQKRAVFVRFEGRTYRLTCRRIDPVGTTMVLWSQGHSHRFAANWSVKEAIIENSQTFIKTGRTSYWVNGLFLRPTREIQKARTN